MGLVLSEPPKHDVEVSVINTNKSSSQNESYPNVLAGKLLDGLIKFLHWDEISITSDEKSNFTSAVEISNTFEDTSNTANIFFIDTDAETSKVNDDISNNASEFAIMTTEMPSIGIDISNDFLEISNITNNGYEVLESIESIYLSKNPIRNERMVDYDSISK